MFLLEPGQTAWDLNWRMFGIAVRVHPMFWLVAAIMGFSFLQEGFPPFLVFVGCFFFSMLIHELGHVIMFRTCGANANIVLYAFGGIAIPNRRIANRWQRIAISFAGPFAEFLIIAAVVVALAARDPRNVPMVGHFVLSFFGVRSGTGFDLDLPPLVELAASILIQLNLFWALLNLLPIFPLDGGQISRDFLDGMMPGGRGKRASLGISLVLAGLLTVHSIATANGHRFIPYLPPFGMLGTIMFASLAIQSFQLLQQESNPPWRRYDP